MGALTSTPKSLPTVQPEVIAVETPAVATATTTATSGTAAPADSGDAAASDADAATAARQGNLLERSRGLLSTVLTSFDGVLNNTTAPARKSLLGE